MSSFPFHGVDYIDNHLLYPEPRVAQSCPTVEIFCNASTVFPPPPEAGRPQDIFTDYTFVTSPPSPPPLPEKRKLPVDDSDPTNNHDDEAGVSPSKRARIWREVNGVNVNGDYDLVIVVPRKWNLDSERKYWTRPDGKFVCARPCGRQSWPTPECRKVVATLVNKARHDGTHLKGSHYYCKPYGCLCEIGEGRVYARVEKLRRHLMEMGQMKKVEADKIAKSLVQFERTIAGPSPQKENRRG